MSTGGTMPERPLKDDEVPVRVSCLVTYECGTRGCYAESVGMSMYCPGVASREAEEKTGP